MGLSMHCRHTNRWQTPHRLLDHHVPENLFNGVLSQIGHCAMSKNLIIAFFKTQGTRKYPDTDDWKNRKFTLNFLGEKAVLVWCSFSSKPREFGSVLSLFRRWMNDRTQESASATTKVVTKTTHNSNDSDRDSTTTTPTRTYFSQSYQSIDQLETIHPSLYNIQLTFLFRFLFLLRCFRDFRDYDKWSVCLLCYVALLFSFVRLPILF